MDKQPVFSIEVELNEDVAILTYLSVVHKIDLNGLIYLYDKYGKDVFFLFYLFAGKDIHFPKAHKYEHICEVSREIRDCVLNCGDFSSSIQQEKDVFHEMENIFNGKDKIKVPVYL